MMDMKSMCFCVNDLSLLIGAPAVFLFCKEEICNLLFLNDLVLILI